MLVSVIIVNYNTFNITCAAIESTIKHTHNVPYEIILVDNASPTDKPDDFLIEFPSITLIKSKENGGFAKGNNIGIRAAKGDIILLLNSDTILTEDSISTAAHKLRQMPDVSAIGVRLVYTDGKLQQTARAFRSVKNEVLDLFRPLLMLMPYKKRVSLMYNQYFHGDYNTYCDWVIGAFMMFNTTLLHQLPEQKLDERFFMYGEDQLWCYQFYELGYRCYYLADTTVIHINNASTELSKQLKLLKKFLELELKIMEYRTGKNFNYYIFSAILTIKEMIRYYIKVAVFKLFRHKMR
ncbi:MAG: glycosyltransferase family 2 protein [Taibaiella sp.]|nr:glycosyltransferase family 2 protein [Taibaiella sp.]